ncbi:nucleotidyltransferase domain-containing protein [Candidatus Pristimantibacillus sp. PTI5]|uniref:nucleotidyltransferase domain-containing protein n=1 Tax=Candidatus Pristimantibacillus sp. PTI5 TaxID=3400422 RepID=UPI003B0130F4
MEKIISRAFTFLNNRGFDWSICGGVAIDIFLGKQNRIHKDVDVAVFWEDRISIIELMLSSGWRVFQACGGGVVDELHGKQDVPFEKRNLFCFTPNEGRIKLESIGDERYRFGLEKLEQSDFTYVEFLFNERDIRDFYLPGETKIKRELNKAILSSSDKIPYLAPEIVLFYKSSYLDGSDAVDHNRDFDVSLPCFNSEQKRWLRESLEREYPNGHPWLQRLN